MKIKSKLKLSVGFLIAVILMSLYYIRVSDTVLEAGDAVAEAVLTSAAYECIKEAALSGEYQDFFSFITNDDGDIKCVITDGVSVNSYTSRLVENVCEYLEKEAADGVNVPAGVFTGTKLFSGFGKKVNFKLIKIISAKCEIISSFESAGINQVKHSVYVNLIPDVTLVAVGRKRHSLAEISVLLYENVIIGKVPKVYMGISSVGECGKTTEKR